MTTPILGPGESGFRLDELAAAWNTLRNDILGRGLATPEGVPASLIEEVGKEYVAWRAWYEDAAKSFLDVAAVHFGSEFSRGLAVWTKKYQDLRAKAVATGRVAAPEIEKVSDIDLGQKLEDWAMYGALGGLALAFFWVWLRRPQQQPAETK